MLAKIANVHRSGYYKWLHSNAMHQERNEQYELIKNHIMAIHHKKKSFGYPRVTTALKKEGILINHKRVYRLMKDMEIQ
jgi:putative transposase